MTTRNTELGEFEHLTLLAVFRLGESAYAPDVARVLEERAGREMSRGTLYGALDRLEQKGFLSWTLEAPTPRRGGRRRRRFEVTPEGQRALADMRTVMERMWEGVEAPLAGEGA